MCGRFALSAPAENIRKHFNLREELFLRPRFNISPGQDIAAIRLGKTGKREFAPLRWGLIPSWAKQRKSGYSMINARAESVAGKSSFRSPFKQYRCLIPANGFFEWKKTAGRKKQPYFIQMRDNGLFSLAGIWSSWTDKGSGEVIESCAVITTVANKPLAEIHDRMPVIIPAVGYAAWLDKQTTPGVLQKMLVPFESQRMKYFPVSDLCNSAMNDTAECINRVDG